MSNLLVYLSFDIFYFNILVTHVTNVDVDSITSTEDNIGTKLLVTSCYCVIYQYYLHILSFVCIEY